MNLEKLDKKELILHAQNLGLNLNSHMLKEDMIAIIALAEERQHSNLQVVQVVDKEAKKTAPAPGRIRINIARSGTDKRQRPVFCGHNNVGYLLPRAKDIDFPAFAISCLSDAIEEAPVWDDELETATGLGGMTLEKRNSYPFQVIAFGESTKDVDMDQIKEMLGY